MKRHLLTRLVGALLGAILGCSSGFESALRDADGNSIRLDDILRIVTNEDFSEDQKRDSLEALGITDENLIEFLLALPAPEESES